MNIGAQTVSVHRSDPNPGEENPTQNYRNVNLLGMNFLRKYKEAKIECDFDNWDATLELIEWSNKK